MGSEWQPVQGNDNTEIEETVKEILFELKRLNSKISHWYVFLSTLTAILFILVGLIIVVSGVVTLP